MIYRTYLFRVNILNRFMSSNIHNSKRRRLDRASDPVKTKDRPRKKDMATRESPRRAIKDEHGKLPVTVTCLEAVEKSLNDSREYRCIQLSNGLRALLVSDLKSTYAVLKDKSKSEEDEEDTKEKMSAAALCIGVGSFSDPPDIPGLAHFLEHMVFLGSEKYPVENEFEQYVKKYGGNSNAYTECERTVFYFDICKENFKKSLDMFAQFFISPLMTKSSTDREIEAVDSEFLMSLPKDSNRKDQLIASFAKDGHPMGKFMWGNKETLKTTPRKQNINIYQRLQEFHKDMYSADCITLAVQSRETLDDLESWVSEIFSPVPNNNKPRPTFHHLSEPYDETAFTKIYKVEPVKKMHRIELTWSMPSLIQEYRKRPLKYLDFMVGHEGNGSLLSYLKKRVWALELTSGNSESGLEMNTTCTTFTTSITLTELGMDHIKEVLGAVFQYLKMLRRVGPQDHLFKEIQTIEANHFRWIEQDDPVDYVDTLSCNLQLYSVPEVIVGEHLLFEYDPQMIMKCLDELVPRKTNIIIMSRKYKESGICDQREEWYKTPFMQEDIPEEWMKSWEEDEPDPELHVPAENTFIASDFTIVPEDQPLTNYPVLVTDSEISKLWYKKDGRYNVPKGYVRFLLKSPTLGRTVESTTLMDLMVRCLEHNLTEVSYPADIAQLSYYLKASSYGFIIKVAGFNHKLMRLFETVVDHIAQFTVEEDMFEAVKEQLRRCYYNRSINPRELAFDVRLDILEDPHWLVTEKLSFLNTVSCDMLKAYATDFNKCLFIEGLVHGNLTAQDAKAMETYLKTKLGCAPIPPKQMPQYRVTDMPSGEWICRVQNFNLSDTNSVITNYFQHGPANLRQYLLNQLLTMRMEEPCFDILRTREQLGYVVYCQGHDTSGILGFSVTVCSQANKFSMKQLNGHINKFLKEFRQILEDTSEDDFEELVLSLTATKRHDHDGELTKSVEALRVLKKCEDTSLSEEVDRYWAEITQQLYVFDREIKEVDILSELTLDELLDWFDHYGTTGAPKSGRKRKSTNDGVCKKLSMQVVGSETVQSQESSDDKDSDSGSEDEVEEEEPNEDKQPEAINVQSLLDLVYMPVEDNTNFINDIITFKRSRPQYPVSKIL